MTRIRDWITIIFLREKEEEEEGLCLSFLFQGYCNAIYAALAYYIYIYFLDIYIYIYIVCPDYFFSPIMKVMKNFQLQWVCICDDKGGQCPTRMENIFILRSYFLFLIFFTSSSDVFSFIELFLTK